MGFFSSYGRAGLAVLALASVHCGRDGYERSAPSTRTRTRVVPALAIVAPPPRASSSGLALGRVGSRLYAFVADEDARALQLIDVERQLVVASLPLPASPGHVIVHDARLAISLRDTREIRTVTLRGAPEAPQPTLDEAPIAAPFDPLALVSDGAQLVVASGSSAQLLRAGVSTALPRNARALLLDADGTARIAHATGSSLTTVSADGTRSDLGLELPAVCTDGAMGECLTMVKPPSIQSYALARYEDAVLIPSVSSLTDGPFPILTTTPPPLGFGDSFEPSFGGYGGGNVSVPITFRVDVVTEGPTPGTSVLPRSPRTGTHECTLPRGMAVDEATHQVWVACLGDGQVLRHVVSHERGGLVLQPTDRLPVPFVTALAYDAESARLVALSPIERTLTLAAGSSLVRVVLPALAPERAHEPEWEAGRRLFVSTDKRISAGKKACASCHPDGGDDGLAWNTPQGKRRTLALAGRLGDKDFGWLGNHTSLELHVNKTITENLRGKGLAPAELAALLRYVGTMQAPASRPLEGAAARGKAVFAGAAECATCHDPAQKFTDGLVHDVGVGRFRTPSLLGIAGRERFFHDGRYRSLDELLTSTSGRMGETASLSADDRRALSEYLATL